MGIIKCILFTKMQCTLKKLQMTCSWILQCFPSSTTFSKRITIKIIINKFFLISHLTQNDQNNQLHQKHSQNSSKPRILINNNFLLFLLFAGIEWIYTYFLHIIIPFLFNFPSNSPISNHSSSWSNFFFIPASIYRDYPNAGVQKKAR